MHCKRSLLLCWDFTDCFTFSLAFFWKNLKSQPYAFVMLILAGIKKKHNNISIGVGLQIHYPKCYNWFRYHSSCRFYVISRQKNQALGYFFIWYFHKNKESEFWQNFYFNNLQSWNNESVLRICMKVKPVELFKVSHYLCVYENVWCYLKILCF